MRGEHLSGSVACVESVSSRFSALESRFPKYRCAGNEPRAKQRVRFLGL